MGSRKIALDDIGFVTEITPEDKEVFDNIVKGNQTEGGKVRELLGKFFKN
jgi:hypothetical protein